MKLLLFLVFLYLTSVESAKILGLFNVPSYSHFSPGQTLMNSLVDRGHDVTVIAAYDDKASKFKTIYLDNLKDKFEEIKKERNFFENSIIYNNYFSTVLMFHTMGEQLIDWTMEHPNMQALLKSDEKFDVVIIEQFINEAFHGLCHHYNASCILYSPLPNSYWLNSIMRNPENPSYMAQMLANFEIPMNFCTRVLNTLALGFQSMVYHLVGIPLQNKVLRKYFPNSPDLRELLLETDLILLNSHLTYTEVGPLVPGMVEIGGFHSKEAGKLPQEFQKFMDESKEGVILFSMGSVLVSADMPVEKREILLNIFKKLNMKVLWKFEEDVQELSKNVKIAKWIPQKEILAHPNTKLFITHGGLSSTIEAVNYGVPVVGLPIFGDQNVNMRMLESKGMGLTVDFWNLKEEELFNAIQTVLNNKQYSETAKKFSRLINDRPLKPIDTATYWIEHIIRHKGGRHLKSNAVDLYWYQYMMIDVVAFLAIVSGVSLWISCFLFKKIFCRKKCAKTVKNVKVSKNKKGK